MKIKDLISFNAFIGAEFKDYKTRETIIDQEKEIEDIYEIQIAEEVEHYEKYCALHRWLIVYLILKED